LRVRMQLHVLPRLDDRPDHFLEPPVAHRGCMERLDEERRSKTVPVQQVELIAQPELAPVGRSEDAALVLAREVPLAGREPDVRPARPEGPDLGIDGREDQETPRRRQRPPSCASVPGTVCLTSSEVARRRMSVFVMITTATRS